jgi:hypothetical protein
MQSLKYRDPPDRQLTALAYAAPREECCKRKALDVPALIRFFHAAQCSPRMRFVKERGLQRALARMLPCKLDYLQMGTT